MTTDCSSIILPPLGYDNLWNVELIDFDSLLPPISINLFCLFVISECGDELGRFHCHIARDIQPPYALQEATLRGHV